MSQRTLVLLKPDAVRRGLTGEIISRIERKAGWQITALELRTLDQETLEQHYGEHKGKPSTSRWSRSWPPVRSSP